MFGGASERLHLSVPADLAGRVREMGLSSPQIAAVLQDFVDDDSHLGLVMLKDALQGRAKQEKRRADEAIRQAHAHRDRMIRLRDALANERRAFTQLVRNAPRSERRDLIIRLRGLKQAHDDADVDIHTVEDLLNRASRANMAVEVMA